ncbi:hypothetical protein BK146_23705 [Paenibacillus sp. FSL R7-0333]|nr:hypothetical protein BK146_23705 [Paenibacillus sp. FSL R7-0333]
MNPKRTKYEIIGPMYAKNSIQFAGLECLWLECMLKTAYNLQVGVFVARMYAENSIQFAFMVFVARMYAKNNIQCVGGGVRRLDVCGNPNTMCWREGKGPEVYEKPNTLAGAVPVFLVAPSSPCAPLRPAHEPAAPALHLYAAPPGDQHLRADKPAAARKRGR